MIHSRRGSGSTASSVRLAAFVVLAAACVTVTVVALATGYAHLVFQVPWKGLVTLAAVAGVAVYARLRARRS